LNRSKIIQVAFTKERGILPKVIVDKLLIAIKQKLKTMDRRESMVFNTNNCAVLFNKGILVKEIKRLRRNRDILFVLIGIQT
jgi:hypothetical protein